MAEEFPSNSNKLKEASLIREHPRIETRPLPEKTAAVEDDIIPTQSPSGVVRARKVPLVREIFVALFPEGWAGLKKHLIWDKLVPWMRESLHAGWDDMGDAIFQGTSSRPRQGSHVSYDKQYRANVPVNTRRTMVDSISADYQEIIWDTEEDARHLLMILRAILREHKVVTLSDYNQEVGNETRPEQNYYGWINLERARIERVFGPEGGYVVVLPRPVEVDIRPF